MGLPSGYKRLQYIQSTGTQYIKTGFVPNQDTRIVYDCYRETASAADHFFGVRTGNTTTNAFNFYIYNSGWRSGYNSATTSVNGPSTGRYLIDKDKNVTYINGETLGTATYASFTSGGEAYLFAMQNVGKGIAYGSHRLYSCQIYDNGTLVRDFIPCQTSDGTVGLWDNINSVFYTNAGTGAFIEGPLSNVSLPSGYRRLEYIQSSGKQYIDTGFKPNQNTRVLAKAYLVDSTNGYPSVFGTRNGSSSQFWAFWAPSEKIFHGRYNTRVIDVKSSPTDFDIYDFNKNTLTINGVKSQATTETFTASNNLWIFGVNSSGSLQYGSSVRLYLFKIYDNGTLIRDFVPCINASGEVGLYDLVDKKFYGNAGTGVFVGGGYTSLETGDILNYDYTGAVQSVTLPKGIYKFEVWGASGGIGPGSNGSSQTAYKVQGLGGYSVGILKLKSKSTLYVYVGGQGEQSKGINASGYAGGFNGGGNGGSLTYTSNVTNGSGGGGASDIRIGQDSLYARVIVAGGGGGASWVDSGSTQYGGAGGGTSGIAASLGGTSSKNYYTAAQPGTQSSGGSGGKASSTSYGKAGNAGTFGKGGNGPSNSSSIINSGAGGGGGWYGGGSGFAAKGGAQGHGAGGSGFVWTGSNAPSGYLLGSEYYLTDASTIAGNASMPSTSGGTETGHTGNGYARITAIKVDSLNLPVNIGGTWKDMDSAYVNIGGTWKTVDSAYVNIGGTWKELS